MNGTAKRSKGISFLLAIISALGFGLQAVLVSLDMKLGNSSYCSLAMRGALGVVILLVFVKIKGEKVVLHGKQLRNCLLLGMLGGAMTTLCLTVAYRYMAAGIVTTLHYLYPFAVILTNLILFKKRIAPATLIAGAIAVLGIFLMADFDGTLHPIGILLVALSIVGWTIQLVFYEHAELEDVPSEVVVLYNVFCQFLLGAVFMLVPGEETLPTGSIIVHLLLSLAGTGVGVFCMIALQNAIMGIGSGLSATLGILEPVGSLEFGIVLLGEVLTGRQWIACGVTLFGILLVLLSENGYLKTGEKGRSDQ